MNHTSNHTSAHTPPRSIAGHRIGAALPLLLLTLLAAGGCASTGSSSSAGASRDEITREQLAEMPEVSAYDAIRRTQARWLRPRGAGTSMNLDPEDIAVYIDDQRDPGGLSVLRSFRTNQLEKIEYFDSRRATTRWGTGHPAGAIVLVLL